MRQRGDGVERRGGVVVVFESYSEKGPSYFSV